MGCCPFPISLSPFDLCCWNIYVVQDWPFWKIFDALHFVGFPGSPFNWFVDLGMEDADLQLETFLVKLLVPASNCSWKGKRSPALCLEIPAPSNCFWRLQWWPLYCRITRSEIYEIELKHFVTIVHLKPTITCPKLTIETLEQVVKYIQS